MNQPHTTPNFTISLDELVWSDTHFGHNNVIQYCKRPFKDINHMDTIMVQNHNEVIGDRRYFHLGDWAFKGKNYKRELAPRLGGHGVLIRGNHDLNTTVSVQEFGFKEAYREAEGRFIETGKTFYMSHIPNKEKAKLYDYHFCGHVHLLFAMSGNTINVGADIWDYKPQTFRYILEQAAARQAALPVQRDIDQSLDERDQGIRQRLMEDK